jgi:hypothetical protein
MFYVKLRNQEGQLNNIQAISILFIHIKTLSGLILTSVLSAGGEIEEQTRDQTASYSRAPARYRNPSLNS